MAPFLTGANILLAFGSGLNVFESLPSLLACELPVDFCPMSICAAIPNSSFLLQLGQGWDAPFSKTLRGIQAQFNLRLIQPASMFRGKVNRKPVPKLSASWFAKRIDQRFPAMDIEVVHDEVDGLCIGVLIHHLF